MAGNITKFDTSGKMINEPTSTKNAWNKDKDIKKKNFKEQNAMINHFVEAKNRQKQTKAASQPGSKVTSIMGKRVDLEAISYDELHDMHDKLINTILSEEEGLISNHRTHVDKMCEFSTSVGPTNIGI